MPTEIPKLTHINQAATRIRPYIHRTPVLTSTSINNIFQAQVFFKCENFQKVGAFKFRGACNAIFSLSDMEAEKGVATHSSGNHAAALSLAARIRGITAYIVMPRTAPGIKKAAVAGYSGKITYCEPTLEARESMLEEVVKRTSAKFIHPYNDYSVIAGQGTASLELIEDISDLDMIITPVGGGGLLSGTALLVSAISPTTKVIAAEPAGADDAYRSLQTGKILPSINPRTIADGLLTSLGDKTYPIIKKYVHQIVTVTDTFIINAMRLVWERMKIIIEPSAAVTLGAILEKKLDVIGKRVGIILSGGNVDLDNLPW
jgi:threonine dehydratase